MRRLLLVIALVLGGAADAQAKLPSSVTTEVAPGGNATVTSPPIEKNMNSMKIEVEPKNGADAFLDTLQLVFGATPKAGDRVLICISVYQDIITPYQDYEGRTVTFAEEDVPLAQLYLRACLAMAVAAQAKASATTAANRCGQFAPQAPATITRTSIELSGEVTAARKRKRKLKISCKPKGAGMTLRVRARKRGRPLRKVVGSKLRFGLYNPPEAEGAAAVKLTFAR